MKMLTTQKAMEVYPSIGSALGIRTKPAVGIGATAAVALTTSSFLIDGFAQIGSMTLIMLPCLWILSFAAGGQTGRPTLRVMALRKFAQEVKNRYNIDVEDNIFGQVRERDFIKGMFGSVRVMIGYDTNESGEINKETYFVMNKGEMTLEQHTKVSAIDMWDRALEHAMTTDEKNNLPTHYSDPGYCKVDVEVEKLESELSKATCPTSRLKAQRQLRSTDYIQGVKSMCGCKNCTPSPLRCTACDRHSENCSCLQSQKYGALQLNKIAA